MKVTVAPDKGRALESLNYIDGNGNMVVIYSSNEFLMPESDVTIFAEFSWSATGPWNIGEGVTAHMDNNTLVIEGEGAMNDFESLEEVPWGGVKGLEKVTIGAEVTKIGKNAWLGMSNAVLIDGVPLSRYALVGGGFAPAESVIPDDMILVTKESITAANTMTISVETNEVKLGVSVKYSEDITAEPSMWKELVPSLSPFPLRASKAL